MLKQLVTALAINVFAVQTAYACGGGGASLRGYIENTLTVQNLYLVASEAGKAGKSALGTSLGVVNGMLFDVASFLADDQNAKDFSKGINAFGNLNRANAEVDSAKVGGGVMGKPSSWSTEEFESLF